MQTEIKYKVVNGISYHAETLESVINVLESVRNNKKRIRVYYGDTNTGKCWNEENDIMGYLGRSTGTVKIPLLINNIASHGGGGLLDNCIIKIKESKGGKVLYQSSNFIQPQIEIKDCSVLGYSHELHIDGILYSRHKTLLSANRLKTKMS